MGNVRLLEEDMVQTELIIPANHRLRPVDLGAILAGGVTEVTVHRRPVAIIPTGSELVAPGMVPSPGQIIEFNSTMFAAEVREWGGQAVVFPITPDDYSQIKAQTALAAQAADIVLWVQGRQPVQRITAPGSLLSWEKSLSTVWLRARENR